MPIYRFISMVLFAAMLTGCQTSNSNNSQSNVARKDPAFNDLFRRIDRLWSIHETGRIFVKPEMSGQTFVSDTRACQNKALERAKLYVTLDDSEQSLPPELQDYMDAVALKVGLDHAIEEDFPNCMKKNHYLLVSPPEIVRNSLRKTNDEQTTILVIDQFIASKAYQPIRAWGQIDSGNAIAVYRHRMKSEPGLMYPVDADQLLNRLEASFRYRDIVIAEGVLSSDETAFLGLSADGWRRNLTSSLPTCDTGMFGVLSVAVNDGWTQGYIRFPDFKPVQVTGLIRENGVGELVSSWPTDNPIKIRIEFGADDKVLAEILSKNGPGCGQKVGLSHIARSLFDEETLADWVGGRLRTNATVIQDYESLTSN